MIIDMHVHTKLSGDSSATAEEYCRAIEKFRRHHPFDGIVITEHRVYHPNEAYQEIAEKYEMLIFQGIEVDADFGHLLLYGITDEFLRTIDISQRHLSSEEVIHTLADCGGIAIPSHPFRESGYGAALKAHTNTLNGITIIEELNGTNTAEQNGKAIDLIGKNGLRGIGGSDAHYANKHWFLSCATAFANPIHTMADLVKELRKGDFKPITIDNTVLGDF